MFLFLFLAEPTVSLAEDPLPPEISARSYIVIDQLTGEVLLEKDADLQLPMASTTKIMTALLALEMGDLNDIVEVSANASRTTGSRAYLDAGERHTLEDLLYAMLIYSANDAAVAIAEHIGGTEENFVRLMNERASQLGLHNTHFANPHGLTAEGHYSTSSDLAKLARVAMLWDRFRQIVVTERYTLPWPARNSVRELYNINDLIYRYEGATGIKTGYTSAAGQCIVASARRGETEVIVVILNAQHGKLFEEAAKLLDYGFTLYEDRVLQSGEELVTDLPDSFMEGIEVVAAGQVTARLPVTIDEDEIEKVTFWNEPPKPPIERGRRLGNMQIRIHGATIAEVPLVTRQSVDVEPRGRSAYLWVIIPVLALYIPWRIRLSANRRRRRMAILVRQRQESLP